LFEAERQLEERQQAPFANLQQWLQFTYEVETKYFEEKRLAAEKQLHAAKEMVGNCSLVVNIKETILTIL